MFKNKTKNGRNNLCGVKIAKLRKERKLSQREIADKLQLLGCDLDKNAVQRIEAGKRFVTDIEVLALSRIFDITIPELFDDNDL